MTSLCGIGLGAWGLYYFSEGVRREITNLATDKADSQQWSLSQVEVEALKLVLAAKTVARSPDGELAPLRRRFDVFYSRMAIVSNGKLFTTLRMKNGVGDEIAAINAALVEMATLIDASDAELRAALPEIVGSTEQISDNARQMSLRGLEILSRESDSFRAGTSKTLYNVAILAVALIVALTILLAIFVFLLNHSRRAANLQILNGARMKAVVETSLDAIVVMDCDGIVLEYNKAAETIFGYTKAEMIGEQMHEKLVPENWRDAHIAGINRFLVSGKKRVIGAGRVKLEALRKDGTVFPVELSISNVRHQRNEIFVTYLRDISAQIAAESELIEARDNALAGERTKAELLAVMSHEMRTPLNGMLGTVELLGDTELTATQMEFVEIMESSGRLLLNHVNDVLDIASLDANKIELRTEPFDLIALIEDMALGQRDRAEKLGNKIIVSPMNDALHAVIGDPARLRQVLLNLLGNAVKFTKDGQIWMEADLMPEGGIEFHVIDTGRGMTEDQLSRIFEDFVTADSSYNRATEGTGLGLGIVQRLVKAMGGTLGVESEPDEGSLFWIKIPLALADPALIIPAPEEETRSRHETTTPPRNILLVEDNPINRLVARQMLEKSGHTVTEAENGLIGVETAWDHPFDLILMDISMPEMDGVSATQALRESEGPNANTPIIALTAHALQAEIERFTKAGMTDTVTKPVSRKALDKVIAAATGADMSQTTSKPAAPTEPALLDPDILSEMWEDFGDERAKTMIGHFLKDTQDRMGKIRATLADADSTDEPLVAQIHSVAGSSAIFGAARLRQALSGFETRILAGDPPDPKDVEATLDALWEQTSAELRSKIDPKAA